MVFEEFFLKKKIDLAQLKDADPSLFEQFKSHYSLMGEKSFDHTKKYWFNKLRHEYPLSAEEEARLKELFKGDKNVPKSEAVVETPNAEVAVAKPAGFRPKFKATVAASAKSEENQTEEAKPATEMKPAGFKPRFKAGTTPTTQVESSAKDELPPKSIDGNQDKEASQATEKQESAPKPLGFKPRFKAGTTPTTQVESNIKEELPPKSIDGNQDKEASQAAEKQEATPKPLGFKPRFKAGTTPTTPAESSAKEELPPKSTDGNQEDAKPTVADEKTAVKPLGFKPRFKTKPSE